MSESREVRLSDSVGVETLVYGSDLVRIGFLSRRLRGSDGATDGDRSRSDGPVSGAREKFRKRIRYDGRDNGFATRYQARLRRVS